MGGEPHCVFPDQEYPSDVEIWLEDGIAVLTRVGSFGPTVELSADGARRLGSARRLAERLRSDTWQLLAAPRVLPIGSPLVVPYVA